MWSLFECSGGELGRLGLPDCLRRLSRRRTAENSSTSKLLDQKSSLLDDPHQKAQNASMKDALSDTLALVDIDAAVYFMQEFQAPWGMEVKDTGFAQFHLVLTGQALLRDELGQAWLSPGELVVYPRGAPHIIADAPSSPAIPGQAVVGRILDGEPVFLGGGQHCTLICGHFAYSHAEQHPLFADLPERLQVSADQALGVEPLMTLLQIMIREAKASQPGYGVIVNRLAEAVFAAILRSHLQTQASEHGFLAGLREPRLRRCLDYIHQCSPNNPSLEDMARHAGMSRSALALAFKVRLGQGPGEYAAHLLLMRAAKALRREEASVELVGLTHGYQSAAAFSRAFRALYGQSPSEYRSQQAQSLAG